MVAHSLFISFAAQGWQGPDLVQWEPALLDDKQLAMRIEAESGKPDDEGHWVRCRVDDIQRVRFCPVSRDKTLPCFHAELTIRTVGQVYAYASQQCLDYLGGRGVAVTEMEGADRAAGRALWQELAGTDEALPTGVCKLVNS